MSTENTNINPNERKLCSCCKTNYVPLGKVKGVYLSRLCASCFNKGSNDVLEEHSLKYK